MPIYYRVLYRDEHFRDWQHSHFHSYHYAVPGEWSNLFYEQNCVDKSQYSVDLLTGKHSLVALDNFLGIAPIYQRGDIWSDNDLKLVSQLEGVCAFRTPESACVWATTFNVADYDKIVEFEGIELSTIPEDDEELSGVLAMVVKPLGMYLLSDFKNKHNLC